MLEVNICKVLLDIVKDQPTVEKVADLLNDEECELKALIQGNGLLSLFRTTYGPISHCVERTLTQVLLGFLTVFVSESNKKF